MNSVVRNNRNNSQDVIGNAKKEYIQHLTNQKNEEIKSKYRPQREHFQVEFEYYDDSKRYHSLEEERDIKHAYLPLRRKEIKADRRIKPVLTMKDLTTEPQPIQTNSKTPVQSNLKVEFVERHKPSLHSDELKDVILRSLSRGQKVGIPSYSPLKYKPLSTLNSKGHQNPENSLERVENSEPQINLKEVNLGHKHHPSESQISENVSSFI